MQAAHCRAIAITGLLAGLVLTSAEVAEAQQVCRRTPPLDVKRLMVPPLHSEDRALGVEATDEIRARLEREFSCQDLIIIPRADIFGNLHGSGFDTAKALLPRDAVQLGRTVRADEYIAGSITRTSGGYRAELDLVLQRDARLVQPLGTFTDDRLSDIARAAADEIDEARKQIEAEDKCVAALRAGNEEEAIQHANFGIQQYPRATLARLCKQAAYEELGFPPDSMLRIANEILEIDPRSRLALHVAALAYQASGQNQRAIETWMALLAADPADTQLLDQAIAYFVTSGNAAAARPIIEQAIAQRPADPRLLETRFLVLLRLEDFGAAAAAGEELARTDTSMVDTTFFRQLVQAYMAAGQPQQAAEAAVRAVAKFSDNAFLHQLHGENLERIGELEAAEQAIRRAVAIEPAIRGGWLQLARIQSELVKPDSAFVSLRQALVYGGDTAIVAQMAAAFGGQVYRQANASKSASDWERVIPWYAFADTLQTALGQPVPTTGFVLGFAAVSLAQPLLQRAADERQCELSRRAKQHLDIARVKLREGATVNQEVAATLLQWVMQALPVADAQLEAFCH